MSISRTDLLDHGLAGRPLRLRPEAGPRRRARLERPRSRTTAPTGRPTRSCCGTSPGRSANDGRPTPSSPPANHVGLAMVAPGQGFAHWRMLPDWVEQTARSRGDAWHDCRLVLRLYDVSCIDFNGFNAHRIQDHAAAGACAGRCSSSCPGRAPGSWREVGFLLRNGEFVARGPLPGHAFPAGRRLVARQPRRPAGGCRGRVEEIGNVWDQDKVLQRAPQAEAAASRCGLRRSPALGRGSGQDGVLAPLRLGVGGRPVPPRATRSTSSSRDRALPERPRRSTACTITPSRCGRTGRRWKQARAFARGRRARLRDYRPLTCSTSTSG